MNQMESLLRRATCLFGAMRQPWALVGGLAVSVRTEPRFTRDVDLALSVPDDMTAEAIVHQFCTSGFKILASVEQEAAHRLATARLMPVEEPSVVLDLLFASSGIEAEICASAVPLEVFPGLHVPVASLHHLIALKVLARDDRTRPQDAADLRALIEAAQSSDMDAALDAVRLIEARGFNRSRNLADLLAGALGEARRRNG